MIDREDRDGFRPVDIDASCGRWDFVQLLAEHGSDVSVTGGYTKPLMDYTKEQGNAERVR
jgi:hypothetical protein